MLACVIVSAFSGCIHTYPNGDGYDPTLVQAGIELSFDINWETNNVSFTKANDKRFRLTIEMTRNNNSVGICEHYLSEEEFVAGNVRLIMPFKLHAVAYKVTAWLDIVEYDGNNSLVYDLSSLSEIRRADNHISWTDRELCATSTTNVNLYTYKDQWGAKAIIPMRLTTPLGRFQIIATDTEKFRDFISESVKRGETYSICLSIENRIARGFNAYEGEIAGYLESPEYYFPFPGDGSIMANGSLFSNDEETFIKARVLVYNSARIIISRSPSIQFPLQRGKVTVIKGDLLTDYYTNSINVNNIWDGEIIIEL